MVYTQGRLSRCCWLNLLVARYKKSEDCADCSFTLGKCVRALCFWCYVCTMCSKIWKECNLGMSYKINSFFNFFSNGATPKGDADQRKINFKNVHKAYNHSTRTQIVIAHFFSFLRTLVTGVFCLASRILSWPWDWKSMYL